MWQGIAGTARGTSLVMETGDGADDRLEVDRAGGLINVTARAEPKQR